VEYNNFYSRLVIPDNDFTDKDRATLNTMPGSPAGGSIHEAALVIGLLRDVLILRQSAPSEGQDSNSSEPAAPTLGKQNVLETAAREKGVDIATALASNAYLKNNIVYSLAWDAVMIEGNSQPFIQNVAVVLKTETKRWTDFATRLGMITQSEPQPIVTDTTPAQPSTDQAINPPATTEAEPLALTPAAAEEAAKTFSKAQEWAGKENYEKAVVEARKVPKGSDQYPAAQENIKNWANKSVQELRRQAANQFRASESSNDAAAKKLYLNKAKNSLQEAISKFPEASSLDTVKENLDIITKSLENAN
jgi:hypothetical protein